MFISKQTILDCLKRCYDMEVLELIFLPIGADRNAAVYRAKTKTTDYFIKIKRRYDPQISIAIAILLCDSGIPQVLSPIRSNEGSQMQRIDDSILIAYPFIEGEDGFKRALTNAQWMILGKTMRQIHEIEVSPSIQSRIRKETYSNTGATAFRSILKELESASSKLANFMKEKRTTIIRLVERAEQLQREVQTRKAEFVLCHADLHGGNVLVDQNDELYIVDWDDPIMAPKERDLMFVGGGVGNVWNERSEEEFFYQGYGPTQVDKSLLSYYRFERILEDIADFWTQGGEAAVGPEDLEKIYELFVGMFKPNGVVDIAIAEGRAR